MDYMNSFMNLALVSTGVASQEWAESTVEEMPLLHCMYKHKKYIYKIHPLLI